MDPSIILILQLLVSVTVRVLMFALVDDPGDFGHQLCCLARAEGSLAQRSIGMMERQNHSIIFRITRDQPQMGVYAADGQARASGAVLGKI